MDQRLRFPHVYKNTVEIYGPGGNGVESYKTEEFE